MATDEQSKIAAPTSQETYDYLNFLLRETTLSNKDPNAEAREASTWTRTISRKLNTFKKFTGMKRKGHGGTGRCPSCLDFKDSGMNAFFRDIMYSAKDGCPSCAILADGVRACISNPRLLKDKYLRVYRDSVSGAPGPSVPEDPETAMGFRLYRLKPKEEYFGELNLFGLEGKPSSWNEVGLAGDISGNTNSDAACDWVLQRIHECSKNHATCNATIGQILPDRVLDLAAFDDSPDIKLRQIKGQTGSYICVSHSWGANVCLQTNEGNYIKHQSRIFWTSLPKGYQDAVDFTRKLGIRYLWIDSLCIIQNNLNDWQNQAGKMATIYQQAFLTIAATKCNSDEEGYHSLAPREHRAKLLQHVSHSGETYVAYVRKNITHFLVGSSKSEFLNEDHGKFPLLNRGWVFQERLLSPRVLHFGPEELAWECTEAAYCECSGKYSQYTKRQRWNHTKASHTNNILLAKHPQDLALEWHHIVVQYSGKDLSFDKDIFPAISGVAQNMQKYRKSQYFAGLWEDSFLDDLVWECKNNGAGRPKKWRGPSWSWASVKGPIDYNNSHLSLDPKILLPRENPAKIVEVNCKVAGQDLCGELDSAYLLISSMVTPAMLCYTDDYPGLYVLKFTDQENIHFEADYDLTAEGDGHVEGGVTVYCLHVIVEPRTTMDKDSIKKHWKVFALVLRSIPSAPLSWPIRNLLLGVETPTCERIGLLKHKITEDDDDFLAKGERMTIKIV